MKTLTPIDGEGKLRELIELFGADTVFLRVGKFSKVPIDKAYTKITLEQSRTPAYQQALIDHIKSGGSIGVLLGPVSGDLIAIDLDSDEEAETFLELNPVLRKALRSKGARGFQLWLRIQGQYHQKSGDIFLAGEAKRKFAEWRSKGRQSVIYGRHQKTRKPYQILVAAAPLTIAFDEIKWPLGSLLPWANHQTQAPPADGEAPMAGTGLHAWILERTRKLLLDGCSPSEAVRLTWEATAEKGRPHEKLRKEIEDAVNGAHEWQQEHHHKKSLTVEQILGALQKGSVSGQAFRELKITPRKRLLGEWFREGDTGFIFSFRGGGKAWLAYGIARAVARGEAFGVWEKGENAVPVGYIDGEMPAELMQERDKAFGEASENLTLINHEILFERTGLVLNLADQKIQAAIMQWCLDAGHKILVIDNLSTLVGGVKENDADAWERLLPWLLDLRRRKIAVVIVHHAGRSGEMRGTSRREDSVFWIIKLERQEDYVDAGCCFLARFEKNRNCAQDPDSLIWTFKPDAFSGRVTITTKRASLKDLVLDLILDGLSSCNVIAKELNCSTGSVSNVAKQLAAEGKIEIDKRRYRPIENSQSPLDSVLHEQAAKMTERE